MQFVNNRFITID